MKLLLRWLRRLVLALVLVWGTLVVGGGFEARARLADLSPWHRLVPRAEMRAADLGETTTLADYLKREEETFAEVRREVVEKLAPAEKRVANRYWADSPLSPDRQPGGNWNRTHELVPETVRGGVLLVHGLTDAPYSVRALAEAYRDEGFYALALRMPGHGTVPGALTEATWEDWLAAVRLGARHVRSKIGPKAPLHFVGYSNGGALVLSQALDAAFDPKRTRADRIVLVSPMVGVTPVARLARPVSLLGGIAYFEKAKWTDVLPEYNPYKYNSFPANAGRQTWELTRRLQAQVRRLAAAGRAGELPPILTFQSLVDATVSTPAILERLYAYVAPNGSELVLFDVNRAAETKPFLKGTSDALLARAVADAKRSYTLTVVANAGPGTREADARSFPPGAGEARGVPLGLAWPEGVFSLSHIALPFRPDDPLFGLRAGTDAPPAFRLGALAPRGEWAAMTVPAATVMRLSSNPFFPYVESRVREAIRGAR
ncbi:MAG TPA: alpha/beta hydrolase [Thermoanaerobaculia bacterium]|nr:alpha/beta hydrolase [Thermoanaerobaculia bacterium]HQR65897.1 alpha/beta hydrolase [Thermoanaerobaculia bacterium]